MLVKSSIYYISFAIYEPKKWIVNKIGKIKCLNVMPKSQRTSEFINPGLLIFGQGVTFQQFFKEC